MAFLTILAIGIFGLLIAGISHISISRERKALLEARARLAEGESGAKPAETKAGSAKAVAALVLSRGAGGAALRPTRSAAKQYRRVQAK